MKPKLEPGSGIRIELQLTLLEAAELLELLEEQTSNKLKNVAEKILRSTAYHKAHSRTGPTHHNCGVLLDTYGITK